MRRNKMRFTSALALGTVLALGAAACGEGDDGGGGSDELTIAYVGVQTGDNSPELGVNISNAVKLAVDQYNATNPAKKVAFKAYDTKGDPAVAPGQVQKAIDDEVTAVVGPVFSGESKATVPSLEEAEIPNISPSATASALGKNGWKYWHRVISNDDAQGQVDAEFSIKTLGAKKIFVIDDNQEYSVGLADKFIASATALGVTPERDKIDPKATDYSSTVNKVKSAKPDVIFFGGYYNGGDKLLKQLRDGGVTAKFLSDDGALDAKLIDGAGKKQAEGALLSCACQSINPTAENPAVAKFIADYKAAFSKDQGTYSAEGYDAATVFLNAFKAGKTSPAELNEYVKTVNFQGVSKPIKFEANGEIAVKTIYMFQVVDGKLKFLGDAAKVKPE
ncbi:branched-chain amino acid ABC transporter substrate-binding protein [Actinomadura chokoriensis]|uniref:Branched-chain amino acid ABC transporter substrate-binding protein n=1 Tax=Actinomadura chokoriensis TaxID=454156 RepID=A0ABV4QXE1_9ACTN